MRRLGASRAWSAGLGAPELAGVAADQRRKEEEKEERREKKKRRKERGRRERKRKISCARVFRRSKPDYIAFGFFVKHEKLPIYLFKKNIRLSHIKQTLKLICYRSFSLLNEHK